MRWKDTPSARRWWTVNISGDGTDGEGCRRATHERLLQQHEYDAPIWRRRPGCAVDVADRRGARVDAGWPMSGRNAREALRRLGDQCRDHAESMARLLSRLYVCAHRKCRQGEG